MPRKGITPKRRDSGPNPARTAGRSRVLPFSEGGHTAAHRGKQGGKRKGSLCLERNFLFFVLRVKT